MTFTNSVSAPPSPLPSITYAYPSSGVVTVTDPGNRQWRLTTDASGRITGIRRPGSASDNITYAYGADGTVSSATKDGVTTTYSRVLSLSTATETTTDPLGNHTVTISDLTKGRPSSFQDEVGRTTAYEYDSNGRLTKVTQPEGNNTQLTYDPRGNVIATGTYDKAGTSHLDTSASFDATCANIVKCNKPNNTTDARGKTVLYTYDPTHGGLTTITRPPASGHTTCLIDDVCAQQRFSYSPTPSASGDSVYQLTSVSACATGTAPSCVGTSDESRTTIGYNSNLLPTSITRSDGTGTLSATMAASYDARGRVITVNGPLADTNNAPTLNLTDTTSYKYDGADELVGVISPDPDGSGTAGGPLHNRAIRLSYRSDGQVSKQELGTTNGQDESAWAAFSPLQAVDLTFDANSRPITSKLSGGGADKALTQTGYDQVGRLKCTAVRMNIAVYGSLPSDACTQSTLGSYGPDQISQIVYDAASEPTQLKVGVATTDVATERTLTYSNNGLVTSLSDGENNKTTYVYDGFDRLSQTQYPSATKGSGTSNTADYEQFTYDENSNVTQYRARSNGTISFGYDNLDRRVSLSSSLVAGRTYTYDLLDRPLAATFTTGGQGVTNTYDALSRLTSSSTNVGGTAHALSYAYDAAGNRTRLTWWDGFFVDYARRVTGEIGTVTANTPAPNSTSELLATYAYDDLRRTTSLTRGNNASTTWGYDTVSRLTSIDHTLNLSGYNVTLTLGYDPASQIVSTTRSNDNYAYGGYTNQNTAYTTNGLNQYTSICASAPCHDGNGNLTADGTNTYTYDIENKLISATPTGGSVHTLSYDPLNRLDLYNPGTSRRFIYDGVEVAAELDASGNIVNRYVGSDDADDPIAFFNGPTISQPGWWHKDERGSIIAMTNPSGGLAINRYDEYGQPQASNLFRFGYTGQMWLPEIGVYYYKARMYHPVLGRFMQTDPIGPEDNSNLYAYVGNDPVNATDPLGLCDSTNATPTTGDDCNIVITGQLKVPRTFCERNPGHQFCGSGGLDIRIIMSNPKYRSAPGKTRKERKSRLVCFGGALWENKTGLLLDAGGWALEFIPVTKVGKALGGMALGATGMVAGAMEKDFAASALAYGTKQGAVGEGLGVSAAKRLGIVTLVGSTIYDIAKSAADYNSCREGE